MLRVRGLIGALALIICLGCSGSKVGQPVPNTADTFLPLKDKPFSVAYADFNSDGLLDAAVAVKYAGIYVYFNRAGTLDLSTPLIIRDLIEMPTSVAVGDFNGDGRQDIAAVSEMRVAIAVSDGTGNFTNSALVLSSPRYGFSLATADFNRDGITDISAVGAMDREVYVYLSTGSLQFALNKIDLSANVQQTDYFARTLSAGDIDNDGFPDIIIPEKFEGRVWLLKNNSGSLSPLVLRTTSMEQMITFALPFYYDAQSRTSYIAAVAGVSQPKLEIITVGPNGDSAVVRSYDLPVGSPVYIDKSVSANSNSAGRLIITHETALTFADFDRDQLTLSNRIIQLKSRFNGHGFMSAYNRDIRATLVVCHNKDGIAVVQINE